MQLQHFNFVISLVEFPPALDARGLRPFAPSSARHCTQRNSAGRVFETLLEWKENPQRFGSVYMIKLKVFLYLNICVQMHVSLRNSVISLNAFLFPFACPAQNYSKTLILWSLLKGMNKSFEKNQFRRKIREKA